MYLIREVFIAKPGHAGELANMMKAEMASSKDFKGHILLDMATDYNKIVCEYEVESLAEFEKSFVEYKKSQAKEKPKAKNKGPKYTDLYLTGKREIYRIV